MDPARLTDLLPESMRRRMEPVESLVGTIAQSKNKGAVVGMLPSSVRGMLLRKGRQDEPTLMPSGHNVHFDWAYEPRSSDIAVLYERAKTEQWNGVDLPWEMPVDPADRSTPLFPDEYIAIHDTPVWRKMNESERDRIRRDVASWTLSQFLHGEQGALYASAQVTETVPWLDAKFYAATQVMDEARHVEVFRRYLDDKVGKLYRINDNLYVIIDALITDPRWDVKFLGMQIMVEGLALGAFGMIYRITGEPLLRELVRNVIRDEARHVHFGVLALRGHIRNELSDRERREREDWAFEVAVLMRNRFLFHEIYEESFAHTYTRRQWDELIMGSRMMDEFRLSLFARLVPNLRFIGLLSDRIRPHYEEFGLLRYEGLPSADQLSAEDLLMDPGQ